MLYRDPRSQNIIAQIPVANCFLSMSEKRPNPRLNHNRSQVRADEKSSKLKDPKKDENQPEIIVVIPKGIKIPPASRSSSPTSVISVKQRILALWTFWDCSTRKLLLNRDKRNLVEHACTVLIFLGLSLLIIVVVCIFLYSKSKLESIIGTRSPVEPTTSVNFDDPATNLLPDAVASATFWVRYKLPNIYLKPRAWNWSISACNMEHPFVNISSSLECVLRTSDRSWFYAIEGE